MKNRKSLMKNAIALAIAVVMCVTMLPAAAFAADADLTIETAEQFRQFRDAVNGGTSYSGKTVLIAKDIDLGNEEFTPIGTRKKPFAGTIMGANAQVTIKNATIVGDDSLINAGVFGFVSSTGTVKDLTFSNIKVSSTANVSPDGGIASLLNADESTTGVAVGSLDGGTIQNVTVDSSCSVKGVLRTGGISGDVSKTGKIINCKNYAPVEGSDLYTGGISGAAHNAPSNRKAFGATVSGCTNYGEVTGTSSVGGILGYADRAKIDTCDNRGVITGTGNYGTGGILGTNIFNIYLRITPQVTSTITSCNNYANVSAPRAGGILGSYVSAPGDAQPTSPLPCVIDRCTNEGAITGTKVGGIFGYQISYAKGDGENDIKNMSVEIKACKNSGSPAAMSGSSISVTEIN